MRKRYVLTTIDDIKNVTCGVIGAVSRFVSLTDEGRYNIALVLNELLVNSFEHARLTPRFPVFVRAELSGGSLHIGVTDGGTGFEYLRPGKDTSETDSLLSERGRGLKLVRALCSDIHYNDRGNSVEVSIAL